MKCRDPKLCYTNEKGLRQLRNFSQSSFLFKKMAQQVFDCGQCIFCRKKRAYELACKCVLHASLYPHQNSFLTLTYDESKPDYHNRFQYKDIQDFKKKLRQHCVRNFNGKKIEIFNVHEYGKNGKKHWHLIVFNHDFPDKTLHSIRDQKKLYSSKELEKLWPYGFNTIGDVEAASAMYQAQYCEKDFKNGNVKNEKKSHSKHSGIGKPYFLQHYKQIFDLGYIPVNGTKLPIPRSFQKIADRHWSHFFDQTRFFDTSYRKAIHRPLSLGSENKELALLYDRFKKQKQQHILELEAEWNEVINKHLETGQEPDFLKSANNYLHDLKQKNSKENF
ncbi:MAG: replication initiator protein [Microvirus sp.]|nr:MAG: replication initiator protein [Microvirus sp.]